MLGISGRGKGISFYNIDAEAHNADWQIQTGTQQEESLSRSDGGEDFYLFKRREGLTRLANKIGKGLR